VATAGPVKLGRRRWRAVAVRKWPYQ